MSSVHQRIVTTFSAHGGNALATLQQIRGGMLGVGTAAQQVGRQTGQVEKQMRALGTTIRYALAGTAVFGAVGLVTVLRDTQRQLALISVLSGNMFDEQGNSAKINQDKIMKFYNMAQLGAIDALTMTKDFNDGLINLFSTVNVEGKDAEAQAIAMTSAIAKGAQLAQVPVDELTKAVTSMNIAFGQKQTVESISSNVRGFQMLTAEAPGGIAAGGQMIQQLGPLSQVSRFANMTEPEMMGMFLTGLKGGGTVASVGRGQQYLMQSIAVPQSDEAAKALKQAGITPDTVQQEGGMKTLRRLMAYASSIGIKGNKKNLTDEQLDILEQGTPEAQAKGLGVSGQGLAWMSKAIGRIHGIRALITLMAQENSDENMADNIKLMRDSMAHTKAAQDRYAKAWKKFADEQPLQAAAAGLDALRGSIAQSMGKYLFNPLARRISPIAQAAVAHPEITDKAVLGGLLAGGGFGLWKLFKGGKGLRGLAGGLGGGMAGMATAQALMTGAQGLGASPLSPLFVVVVGQLNQLKIPGVGNTPVPVPGPLAKAGKYRSLGALATPVIVGTAIGLAGAEAGLQMKKRFPKSDADLDPLMGALPRGSSLQAALREMHQQPNTARSKRLHQILDPLRKGYSVADLRNAEKQISGMNDNRRDVLRANRKGARGDTTGGSLGAEVGRLHGEAAVTLDLLVRQPDGKTQRVRQHVPMTIWTGGKVPQFRGTSDKAGKGAGGGAATPSTGGN